jgi:hypothetical protein
MNPTHPTPVHEPRPALAWVVVPAVVMSLGWGLRGYIGGGSFGAMIPGVLVSLILCQYLGYGARASAVVVAFGTVGIGYGGGMTYGQTLGLLRDGQTFYWGLTGTTLKGGVWGLLGGAVLGLGFAARHVAWRHLALAFACMLAGVIVGIHFVNQPKLIYFSDPVNQPRAESWAGFLLGGLALLAYVRLAEPDFAWLPTRFAAYGAIGGAVGFGGGSLLLAFQSRVAREWAWMPYWKYMEFTFGLVFGAALGLCALHLRGRLEPLETADDSPDPTRTDPADERRGPLVWLLTLLVGAAVLLAVFRGWPRLAAELHPALGKLSRGDPRQTAARVLLGFTGLGCVLMLFARSLQTVAWQVAVSVTVVAAAIDWQRNLLPRGNIDLPELYRDLWVLGAASVCVVFVSFWQNQRTPRVIDLFLFATCAVMAIGYMKGLGMSDLWWPNLEAEAAAGSRAMYLWRKFRSEAIVHLIFTALFALSLWAGVRERRRARSAGAIDSTNSAPDSGAPDGHNPGR